MLPRHDPDAPAVPKGCAFVGGAFIALFVLTLLCIISMSFLARTLDEAPPRPFAPTKICTEIRREIRVRAACDEEFRAQPQWREIAARRVATASEVFEVRFGIRWKVVDVVPWTSDDAAGSLAAVLDQLERDVPRKDVDVVIGFSGQNRAKGSDRDYRIVGMARYFGPCTVVTTTSRPRSDDWYRGELVHELGHVLGAWHCVSFASVMQWSGDRESTEDFDPQSAAVMEITRGLDFSRGVLWLDEPLRRRIDAVFRAGHIRGMDLPYVDVELDLGRRLLRDGDVAGARAVLRRAIAEEEACVGPADPSLVDVLRPLAWADLAGPERDLDEAERLAVRSHDIATENSVAEEPPCDGEALGAAIAWERGRRDEAIRRLVWAYDGRLNALGAFDPYTVELKRRLEQWTAQTHPAPHVGGGK
jgi:hypothetical protein